MSEFWLCVTSSRSQHLKRLALPSILLLAVFLRLFGLQNGQYGSDDERLWSMALSALAQHSLPIQGIKSSIGIGNGPFQVYLMMPPALVTRAPILGSVTVALLNIGAVYFLYRFVREFFSQRSALIAALLFSVNSWAIIYARRMQAQDLLVPFQVLFFWNAARWLTSGRWRDLALMFLWLAILTQVYILGLLHVVTLGVILLIGWRRLRPLPLFGALLPWAALSYRYLAGVIIPFRDSFRGVSGGSAAVNPDSVGLALTMATHKGFQTIAGQAGSVFDATSGIEAVFVWIEALLFAAGVIFVAVEVARALRLRKLAVALPPALLLLWLVVPVALFIRHSVPLYPYYFVALIPLPAIFSALVLDRFWDRIGGLSLALLGGNSLAVAGIFFAVIPGYYTHNDYGLPYQETFKVAAQVQSLVAGSGAGRVYVDGDMDPSDVMSSVLKRDGLDVFWFDDYRTPEFAAPPRHGRPAVYVTMADDTDTARYLLANFADQQRFVRRLSGQGVSIRAYVLRPEQVRAALDTLLPNRLDLTVANGARIEAWGGNKQLSPGASLHAEVGWSWNGDQRPSKLRYSMFAHIVNASGKAVAGQDYPLLPSPDWVANERVVQWITLPLGPNLPAGRYSLELGMYAQRGVVRQALRNGSGNSLGSSVLVGPFVMPPPPAAVPASATKANVAFADGITLSAYQWNGHAGGGNLDLYWLARSTPSRRYTVYIHVLDPTGKMIAQADGQPDAGSYPTNFWMPSQLVKDTHSVTIPPGHYTVEVGLYYLPTLERPSGGPLRFAIDVP